MTTNFTAADEARPSYSLWVTNSGNPSAFFEDGKRVYPCRCGQIHKGDYACEEWMKHQCLHNCALVWLAARVAMCPLCATSWFVKGEPMVDHGMVAVDYGLDEVVEQARELDATIPNEKDGE